MYRYYNVLYMHYIYVEPPPPSYVYICIYVYLSSVRILFMRIGVV